MVPALWVVVLWMLFVIMIALLMLVWAGMTGQFKDIEAAKYRMLDDREPEGWPGRPASSPSGPRRERHA